MSGKNLLSMFDRPVFTACGIVDSTLREKPPKTVTSYENLGRLCNLDEPEWNQYITRETAYSTTMAHLEHPGIRAIKAEAWESADVE